MATEYVSDYEEVTGKQRDADVTVKVVTAAEPATEPDATAVAETKEA